MKKSQILSVDRDLAAEPEGGRFKFNTDSMEHGLVASSLKPELLPGCTNPDPTDQCEILEHFCVTNYKHGIHHPPMMLHGISYT